MPTNAMRAATSSNGVMICSKRVSILRQEWSGQDGQHTIARDIPEQRADERYAGDIKRGVDHSAAEIGDGAPMGQCAVNAGHLGNRNRRDEERKRLEVIAEVALEPPCDRVEPRHLRIARTCSPSKAVLHIG